MSDTEVGIPDCEQNQAAWFRGQARATGGEAWEDRGLDWVWIPPDGSVMLLFPTRIESRAVERGVERAWGVGARSIGAWLGSDIDAAGLAINGFERAWAPWWMTAPIEAIGRTEDTRVGLEEATPEYDEGGRALLSLASERPAQAWHAVARIDGGYAGRAWTYRQGSIAGVYDMEVLPAFRRRGLGSSLLRVTAAAAGDAGASHVTLNATPMGERLYSALGFRRIGDGITWWLHRP